MTTLYVVVDSVGGYAREDADRPGCAGVYTDPKVAETVAKLANGARVIPVELDYIHPGHYAMAIVYGYKL